MWLRRSRKELVENEKEFRRRRKKGVQEEKKCRGSEGEMKGRSSG